MKRSSAHRNCSFYAPVDAAKGICHKTKQLVQADSAACKSFAAALKCSNCKNYAADAANPLTGVCKAAKDGFFAYADMSAGTCKTYAG